MMRKISFTDVTVRENENLTFKEKVEMAKIMDKLNYAGIDLPEMTNPQTDSLLIKTLAMTLKDCRLNVPVGMKKENIKTVWDALKKAKKPTLKVSVPTSTVQMEYVCHKKPAKVLELITELVTECKKCCNYVEFEALDATRAEYDFLVKAINNAMEAGANKITLCDTAGTTMPSEFGVFIKKLVADIPELTKIEFAVLVDNELHMSNASCFAAVESGANEIKTNNKHIEHAVNVIDKRGSELGLKTSINTTELQRGVSQMVWAPSTQNQSVREKVIATDTPEFTLTEKDTIDSVAKAAKAIGYTLSNEDKKKVFEAAKRVIAKKNAISTKELEVIIATSALTVPSTYEIENYVINSGNIIQATANIKLRKGKEILSGIGVGDGPIDAAFTAIDQILGHTYELDDFQIQTVTEGRESMGQALVKLRAEGGKLYSGNGISTDIIGASIRAYVAAINKIVYEEA